MRMLRLQVILNAQAVLGLARVAPELGKIIVYRVKRGNTIIWENSLTK